MKPECFKRDGSVRIERHTAREGPSPFFVVWKPNICRLFTDQKAMLKFIAWPKSTPTGTEIREWLESFDPKTKPKEEPVSDPTAHTKMIT